MCITVVDLNLGPADVLLDTSRRLLALSPDLTDTDRRIATRRVLEQAGYVQRPLVITCICGQPMSVDPLPSAAREAG